MADVSTWTTEHLEAVRAKGVHKIIREYWATKPHHSRFGLVGTTAHFVTVEISDPGEPPEPGLRRFANVLLREGNVQAIPPRR